MSASRERKLRQAQAGASMTEKEKKEAKQAKSLKVQTAVFIAVCALMVLVLVVYGILSTGIVEKNTTALKVGEHKITAAEMNYFYVNQAYTYYNENSSYISYFISSSTPLDEQIYDTSTGSTWADVFMDAAVTTARDTYALYDEALASGFTLSDADLVTIDSSIASLDAYATLYGFSSANAYLRAYYGRGCSTKSYREYITIQQTVSSYITQFTEDISYTDEELAEYEAQDPLKYNSYDYRCYYIPVSDFYETDATDEEKAAAQETAKSAAEELASAGQESEEAFIAAVNVYEAKTAEDTDSSEDEDVYDAETATLNESVLGDEISSILVDWVTDSGRSVGDCEAVPYMSTTEGQEDQAIGYYVTMFLGSTDNTDILTKDVRHILIYGTTEDSEQTAEDLLAEFEENPTEENFASLAEENSADTGSNTNGGLYEAVQPGQMVTSFNDWCFNEGHVAGDYGIITSDYGYHLMYMVGDNISYRKAMIISDYKSDVYSSWYTDVTEAYTAEFTSGASWVNTSIYLGSS